MRQECGSFPFLVVSTTSVGRMTSGTLMKFCSLQGSIFKLSHHFSALSQGSTKEAVVYLKNMIPTAKKEAASFISPSAAARDKAIVSCKQRVFTEMHFSSISSQPTQL